METPSAEHTEVYSKTEADLQNEVAELKAMAEAKLRIWRAANTIPPDRRWFTWILRRLWTGEQR